MKNKKVRELFAGFPFWEKMATHALHVSTLILLVGLALGTSVAQESRATLEGSVTDQHGAVIPKASIEVVSEETGVKQKTATNPDGMWAARFLNPGTYQVTVTAQGFKTAEQRGIKLEVADDKRIETVLSVGTTHEVASVTADAPLIDTSSATAGTVIESATIQELPMESRISYLLAGLAPGVHLIPQNENVAYMWSYNAASDIRVNGGRDNRSNEFLLDGMPNQQRDKVAYIPPADSVQEFRVMTNAYDAQYGRQAGGTFNVALRSGTEKYHGSLYEHYQGSTFNANRYEFNHAIPKVTKPNAHYHLYGGTLGGPVIVDRRKTFFFVNWEGIRNKDPRSNAPLSLPTLKERAGDFRDSFTTETKDGVRIRRDVLVYDPRTLTGNTRPLFYATSNPADVDHYNPVCHESRCDRVIPISRFSPIALNILKYVPAPNNVDPLATSNTNNDYIPLAFRQNKMASVVVRVDHSFNDHQKTFLTTRWNHEDEYIDDFFHDIATGGYGTRINRGAGIDHVWTITPTRILNVRYNVTRFEEPNRSHGSGFNPADLGFPQSLVSQMRQFSFPRITGVFADKIGGDFGNYTNVTYHTWMASITQTYKNMTWHYGGDYRVIQEARGGTGNQSGSYSFNGNWTRKNYDTGTGVAGDGSGFASFLLGLPAGGDLPRNATSFDSQHFYSLYFQNDWRLTHRLTINLGLRWDYENPFVERFNRFTSVFDTTQLSPVSDQAQAAYTKILNTMLANADPRIHSAAVTLAQLVPASSYKIYGVQLFPGVDGVKRTVTNGDLHEWQPRVGFAYQLFHNTVVRGGFGRFVQGTGIRGGQNGFSRSTPFLNSLDGGKHPYDTWETPFHTGIFEPTGSSLGPLTNLQQGLTWVNQNPLRPYSWQYSFQIQHQIKSWLFEAGYSHQNTYHIQSTLEQNDIGLSNWLTYHTVNFDATGNLPFKPGGEDVGAYHLGNEFLDTQIPNPFKNLSVTHGTDSKYCIPNPLPADCVGGGRGTGDKISVYDLMRTYKLFGGLGKSDIPDGRTHWDALQTKIQRRFANGYSMLVSYTYSKLVEITSFLGPQIRGVREHKIGGEDTPHKISFSSIYELPIGRNKKVFANMPRALDYAIGGWQLSGQYSYESGLPVVFGTNSFFDGKRPVLHGQDPSLHEWFDTSHFYKFPGSADDLSTFPAWTGVQNLPGYNNCVPPLDKDGKPLATNCVYRDFDGFIRNYPTRWTDIRRSSVNETNLAISKNFLITEKWKAQFRGEAFNLLNHPRFLEPDTNPGSNNFGVVSPHQYNEPRVIQFAVKVTF